jgi:NADH-quinone oxidoreductase subunit M
MLIELLLAVTLASAFGVFLAPNRYAGKLATGLSLLPLGASLLMWNGFDGSGNALLVDSGELAFETVATWLHIGDYAIQWHVGVDGVSLPLVVLTTVLTTLALISSWTPIDERESQFYGLMLLMETALLGVFTALDFFLWFVFWEGVLIPMYFLIGVWGGPRRKYAAIKFLVYTNVASLVMFLGLFGLVFGLGDSISTLGLPEITQAIHNGGLTTFAGIAPETLKLLAFVAMFAGFAVKVPIAPFHTWLPDAHVEATSPATTQRLSPSWASFQSSTERCSHSPNGTSSASWPTPPSRRWAMSSSGWWRSRRTASAGQPSR